MVRWPDNPPVELRRVLDLDRGDPCTVSLLSLGTHAGTHVDAPGHFIPGGSGVDGLPLSLLMGNARVIEVPTSAPAITTDDLRPHALAAGERILLRTSNTPRCWETSTFVPDYAHLSVEAARFLVERGVQLVGADYLSIGGPADGAAVHQALLGAGVVVLEGLDLRQVPPGPCELIALPLRIAAGDGAPARVLVRPLPARRPRMR